MSQLQPVLWTKGLLLAPQHFQMQDRYLGDLLRFRLSALSFAPWGFSRLAVDREALAAGTIALSQGAGLLPDGLPFEFPAGDIAPAPRPLEGAWEQDQTELDVHLAIPEYRPGGLNVSTGGRETRWLAEDRPWRDENTGMAERPVQVARANLRLLFGHEVGEGSTALRAARVRRTAAGVYELDPRFVPPLLDLPASDYLMAIARRLVEILVARSTALASARRQRNQSLAEFGLADTAGFWLLYTANTYLPLMRHLYETKHGHPSELYETMLGLAGALTSFSSALSPRDLPAYDHENLGPCFTRLDEILRQLLETVVPAGFVSIPLRLVRPTLHAAALEQDRYVASPNVFLAVKAEGRPADLVQRFPQLAKLSSGDRIEVLVRQALPGVPLVYTPNPPAAVPVKSGHFYFQLMQSGAEWDAIARARNVAAYVPAEIPAPEMELVILLPKS